MPRSYFFAIVPMDLYNKEGDPLPDVGAVLNFTMDREHAHAQLFRRGFMIPFEDDIFVDDGARFKYVDYQTGNDKIPKFLGFLTDNKNPYPSESLFGRMDIGDMYFGKLRIHRFIEPDHLFEGGKRKKRGTARRLKKGRGKSRRN